MVFKITGKLCQVKNSGDEIPSAVLKETTRSSPYQCFRVFDVCQNIPLLI